MIDFSLAEDHHQVAQVVQEFGKKHVLPDIKERDQEKRFDCSLFKKMAELDLLGICIPAKYGGAGMDYISLGVACEELEYFDTSARVVLSVHTGLNSMNLLGLGPMRTRDNATWSLRPRGRGSRPSG